MEKCRVCYKDFNKEKIEAHVALCGEVALIKKDLENICEKMSEYSRQAFLMHSNLTSTANAQRKLHKKQNSRSGLPISDPNSPSKLTSSEETPLSEEEVSTPTRPSFTRQGTGFLDIDTIKKMTPEEYTKFMEESNKSIYALNKVLSFSDRIQQLAFLFGEEDDPDNRALVEMQICCKEVKEQKALEFIQAFDKELTKYVEKKLEYTTQNKKLSQIGKTTEEIRKERFFAKKGNSMKKMSWGSKSTGPMKFKEDTGITPLKEESRSPKSPKSPGILGGLRKKPSLPKDHQFFSPLVSKRALPTPGYANLANLLKSPVLEAYGASQNRPNTAATASTNKLQMNKSSFLQSQLLNTNSNHIANSHLLMKKTSDGGEPTGMSLRDMVKKAVGQKTGDSNSMKSPGLNSSQLSSSQLLNSPNTKQLYKEKAANRKSRFSETTSLMAKLTGAVGEQSASPVKQQIGAAGMAEIPEETKPEESKLAKSRAKSLNALKLIQKVEDSPSNKEAKKFTSLAQTSYIWGKDGEKTPEKPPKADKLKKKKSDELANLVVAGASSDPNHKWKRNLPFMESNQVGIDSFRFIRFLGRGAYGVVWLVEHKLTKDPYAMKIIDAADALAQNRMYALEAEQGIYEVLQGDFVVKAVYTFEHDSFICFVTELMIGGDFNSILEEFGRLEKEQAQFYFAELILAVESLHNENIVHRDLKPENILMDGKGHIRLTDFGLSNKQNIMRDSTGPKSNAGSPLLGPETSNSKLDKFVVKEPPVKNMKVEFKVKQPTKEGEFKVFNAKRASMIRFSHKEAGSPAAGHDKKVRIIGTPDYIAPEILNPERYPVVNEKSVDWWSMGVILYEFMVGIPPFNADTREDIFDNIRNLRMEWPEIGDGEDCMSADTQDLIKKLLNPNPNTRLGANGAAEIKKHHFFEGFDWDNLTKNQAPIIPDCKLDMTDYGQFDGKNNPFGDSEGRKKNKLESTSRKKFFNMTRIELLQKMTLDKIQQPQKVKMIQSKKPF